MPSLNRTELDERPLERNGHVYRQQADDVVTEDVLQVDREMRGKPAHMVYELLSVHLTKRLPGVPVDENAMRDAAARIAFGFAPV